MAGWWLLLPYVNRFMDRFWIQYTAVLSWKKFCITQWFLEKCYFWYKTGVERSLPLLDCMHPNYIMSNTSQVIKVQFLVWLKMLVLSQRLDTSVETNCNGIVPFKTCKCRQAIENHSFDLARDKLAYKYI